MQGGGLRRRRKKGPLSPEWSGPTASRCCRSIEQWWLPRVWGTNEAWGMVNHSGQSNLPPSEGASFFFRSQGGQRQMQKLRLVFFFGKGCQLAAFRASGSTHLVSERFGMLALFQSFQQVHYNVPGAPPEMVHSSHKLIRDGGVLKSKRSRWPKCFLAARPQLQDLQHPSCPNQQAIQWTPLGRPTSNPNY